MIVGHQAAVEILQRRLPPVTLLLGPPSIGKRTLTEHLGTVHQVPAIDRHTLPEPLSIAAVRQALTFVATRPHGRFKLVTGRLDNASTAALNALLKTLEEPPETARFLLTCARPTLPTVMSRCQLFRLGLLSTAEVAEILVHRGMSPSAAGKAARLAHGQVGTALQPRNAGARDDAVAVLKAIAERNHAAFEAACKTFSEDAVLHLRRLLVEATTGNFEVFGTADTFGLYRDQPLLRRMLIALHQNPAARSRLGVRAALEIFVGRT